MFHSRAHRRVFVYVVVIVTMLIITAHAQVDRVDDDGPTSSEPQKSSKFKSDEELFKKLFNQRRRDHMEAIRTLLKMDNYERVYKMIETLTEKVVEVIESSKSVLEKAGFVPNDNSFPKDANVKDALSNILENIAFFGDILLHLPDITHRILKTQQGWNPTIHWSLSFTNQMRHLLNKSTITMIRLVEQKLNITERDPSYFNPYSAKSHEHELRLTDRAKKNKSVKKEKRKKGPQIAKIEL